MKQLSVMEDQIIKVSKFFTITGGCIALELDKAYLITGSLFRREPNWVTGDCRLYISTENHQLYIGTEYTADIMCNKISVQERSTLYLIGEKMFELTKDELNDFIIQKFI